MEFLGALWNEILVKPLTNSLLFLAVLLFHNFGLSIIAFTGIVRLVTYPLAVRQAKSAKAMAQLQPKLQALQKKYANDRQRFGQEQMRLYKEEKISPIGCLGPMIIQMPIWFAMYYAISKALNPQPESMVELSGIVYPWANAIHRAIPFNSQFLGMDLSAPASLNIVTTIVMPVLVGGSMWALQKMSTYPSADPKQNQQNQMMVMMMPLMFGFFTFSFPNGLSLYWIVSNLIGMVVQYFVAGWGGLGSFWKRTPAPVPAPAVTEQAEELPNNGTANRDERQNNRRGNRSGSQTTRGKEE
ncbi:MAG: YidC/Oxa1 family membrane protein insertase [Dehalococcoidia bacterium]|nr:YidC/Oxa1 family membrane protein insertase [Dehalococcoidia bacterium]